MCFHTQLRSADDAICKGMQVGTQSIPIPGLPIEQIFAVIYHMW